MSPRIDNLIKELTSDNTSGASDLCIRTGEILRLIFQTEHPFEPIIKTLLQAQPAMAPLINLINDSLVEFEESGSPAALRFIDAFLHRLHCSSCDAAQQAAAYLQPSQRVLTISYSRNVYETFKLLHQQCEDFSVIAAEGRPVHEGTAFAKRLADDNIPVTLTLDAALFQQVMEADAVLVGADALISKGLVNKIGTAALAYAAKQFLKPFYVVTTMHKFLPPPLERHFHIADRNPSELAPDGLPASVTVINRYFDVTPWHLVDAIITEQGETTIHDLISSACQRKIASLL